MILTIAFSRLLPHPFNFTPVMGIALFAGAKFNDRKWSLLIPVVAMLLSDIGLSMIYHYPVFHDTIFFVYGSVLLASMLGWRLKSEKLNAGKTVLYTLISSILFFVITNIAVWVFDGMYSMDAAGLVKCFVMAIPFFKNALAGDIFYVALLFGAYELLRRRLPAEGQLQAKAIR